MTSSIVTRSVFDKVLCKTQLILMHEKTTAEQSLQHIFKIIGVTHELPAKIASYHGLPRVNSNVKKFYL